MRNGADLLAKIETEVFQFLTQLITQLRHEFLVHVVAPRVVGRGFPYTPIVLRQLGVI